MLVDTENSMREKFNALLTESEENARKFRVEQEKKHKEEIASLTSSRIVLEESHINSRREFEAEVSVLPCTFVVIYLLKCIDTR
jgi:hypothetical protein